VSHNILLIHGQNGGWIAQGLQVKSRRAIMLPMLTKQKKANEVKKVSRHDADTGSPEVQVALLTRRIDELSTHLKKNAKDKHSRRGLLGLVADRRRHLKYLEATNKRGYNALVKKLGLKK
jgi:small subunit ribosomal protein S15